LSFSAEEKEKYGKRESEKHQQRKAGHGGPLMVFEAKEEAEIWIWLSKGCNGDFYVNSKS